MMCLGWKAPKSCNTSSAVQVTNPASCPDITWFWLGLGVVLMGAVTGKKGGGAAA